MQLWSSPLVFSSHPVVLHQLPQVIDHSELLWIHLMDSKKERHVRLPVGGNWKRSTKTSNEAWQDCECVSSQRSYPPSGWWIFPTGRWRRPQPRPCGRRSPAARFAASAPSSQPPPHHCCSSHEIYPAAKETPTEAWWRLMNGKQLKRNKKDDLSDSAASILIPFFKLSIMSVTMLL